MQVDDVGHVLHDLGAQQVGNAPAQGATLAAREAAVQVAAVRQVTGALHKTEDIDDGHRDQGAPQVPEC